MASCACRVGLRAGVEHDPAAARRGHLGGEEQAEAAEAAGDDVGAVAAEDLSLLRRHHHAAAPAARYVEHELAGVLGAADHPDGGGRIGESGSAWSPAVAATPSAVSSYTLLSSSRTCVLMGVRQQREIDAVEREVAAEREETQPGVAVDVALADLDESSTEGQQFQAGASVPHRAGS